MKIELKTGDITEIQDLLKDWPYDPLDYLRRQNVSRLCEYYLNDIQEILNANGSLITAKKQEELLGFTVLADLPWDSKYFNKKMGAIKYLITRQDSVASSEVAEKLIDETIQIAKENQLEFLLCKCSTNDIAAIHALERQGFLMMDTMLDFTYDYQKRSFDTIGVPLCPENICIRLADKNDQDELVRISQASFENHFGRYHADSRIPLKKSTGVYEQWLKSSCEGWADWIVVAEHRNEIAGYSVWKRPSDSDLRYSIELGHYSIGAIAPTYQQKGLFTLLTYEGMKILRDHCKWIVGPTHVNNYGVQKGYLKLGWRISGARHSFHKWI